MVTRSRTRPLSQVSNSPTQRDLKSQVAASTTQQPDGVESSRVIPGPLESPLTSCRTRHQDHPGHAVPLVKSRFLESQVAVQPSSGSIAAPFGPSLKSQGSQVPPHPSRPRPFEPFVCDLESCPGHAALIFSLHFSTNLSQRVVSSRLTQATQLSDLSLAEMTQVRSIFMVSSLLVHHFPLLNLKSLSISRSCFAMSRRHLAHLTRNTVVYDDRPRRMAVNSCVDAPGTRLLYSSETSLLNTLAMGNILVCSFRLAFLHDVRVFSSSQVRSFVFSSNIHKLTS
jgi:hypothetical protein